MRGVGERSRSPRCEVDRVLAFAIQHEIGARLRETKRLSDQDLSARCAPARRVHSDSDLQAMSKTL